MDPEKDTLVAFGEDGRVAALCWVYAPRKVESKHRAFLWFDIHPDHRSNGLGDFVLAWSEARGRQILAERPADMPRIIRSGCMDTEQYRRALLERHGYEIIRYFYTMRRDLSQPIADVVLPDGITLQNWSPEIDERVFEASNEAFRDHWGFEPSSRDQWERYSIGRESFRSDLSFIAMDGEEVAGFSINYLSQEENERNDIQEAWVGDLAVRRRWRKRGLATALLNQSMQAFKTDGMDFATLGVDTENPTGALGVYQRVGFVQVKRSMTYFKDVVG